MAGNDAQTTIGIIWLLLTAAGISGAAPTSPPDAVIGSRCLAIGPGTLFGGWRVPRGWRGSSPTPPVP